ncbi:phosphoglycerate mutase [Arthrobacter crystallopoietes BAB-32]|uniref:Phosphoglycerate mutase n=1 Tax=Arthrobacter crystallopoietes BAB-32 TaxID=1246476 RepID=N1VAY9_9MICC|nr:MSMEG_4193 family putative phosphomutase [Arthrobacter crystallopoietes]EMY35483.1 phosphoglycerate mutase [Arthrobacter crystallopoietes BAB-32]
MQDQIGRDQAALTGDRLAAVPVVGVVSSALERCRETAQFILDRQAGSPDAPIELDRTECDYGEWQDRAISDLATEDLWPVVQSQPSAVVFPCGESLAAMQGRSVAAIRRHDAAFETEHGSGAVWAAVSHGDVMKSILADALDMHLDLFQRINVGPGSVSIVGYGVSQRLRDQHDVGDLSWLSNGIRPADAPVGGGSGQQAS